MRKILFYSMAALAAFVITAGCGRKAPPKPPLDIDKGNAVAVPIEITAENK